MIINHNLSALNANRQLRINNGDQSKSLEKLSSGYRINRAGDDAAGLAISEKMRSQIKGLNQASRNAQDGISLIQTAEGALNESHAIAQRMRELAVQSATGTLSAGDRSKVNAEFTQLTSELNRIATTTQFNNINLLNASQTINFQVGANSGQTIGVTLANNSAATLGVTAGIKVDTATNADSAITALDGAISTLSDNRANLGAVQNRLEHTIKNLDVASENLQASESRIRDTDMASEMSEFTKNNILTQAATAMLAQANQTPQTVLSLLK